MREVLRDGSILLTLASLGALAWLYTPDESRTRLEARGMRGPPSMFLDILGLRLHVRDTGPRTAPAVIFLHGFGGSLQTWESWSRDLARDHRVVRYDLPGFGLTGADPTGDYSDARGIAVLLALMRRLGIGRASIVGHSWAAASPGPSRPSTRIASTGWSSCRRTGSRAPASPTASPRRCPR